ncbi:hypothetical protein GYMLUDRAFT_252781 [Collybiopsis luxurians FD-317 M1]|uniref:Uncharacterized protein n=1 Tax=Collybiopsis luxurians FD-317 M1 TaxID=944289 RepID=A0A0D0AKB2_9AGAR|nr:hypothetical protein GYMLUDRAFT_252781 [Collybiopsis luxurians FD-317 M1]
MGSSGLASKTSNAPSDLQLQQLRQLPQDSRKRIEISEDESDREDEIDFLSSSGDLDEELARRSASFLPQSLDIDRLPFKHNATDNLHFQKSKLESDDSIIDVDEPTAQAQSRARRKEKEQVKEPLAEAAPKERTKQRPQSKPVPKKLSVSRKLSSFSVSPLFRPPVGKKPLPAASPSPATASPGSTRKLNPPKPIPSIPATILTTASPENTPNGQLLRIQPQSAFPVSPMSPRLKLLEEDECDAPLPLGSPQVASKAGPSHMHVVKRKLDQSTEEEAAPLNKRRRENALLSSLPPLALSDDDDDDEDEFYNSATDAT